MVDGEILDELNISPSTLSHHLSKLTNLDLVRQERDMKTISTRTLVCR